MKRLILFFFLLLLSSVSLKAQLAPLYSQYLVNGLVINPAYAGSRDALSASAVYRDQWTGMEGAPTTQTLSIHSATKKRVGLGLMVFNDKIGVTRRTGVGAQYAYRLPLGKAKLALGVGASLLNTSSRWSTVYTGENADPSFTADEQGYLSPNASAGIYYHHPKWYVGLSATELFTNTRSRSFIDPSNVNTFLTAGFIKRLSSTVVFKPSVLFKYHKTSPFQADVSASFFFRELLEAGVSYRSGDAIVGFVQLAVTPQFKVGYSYDRSFSMLSDFNNGSHEVILHYEFRFKAKATNPRYF